MSEKIDNSGQAFPRGISFNPVSGQAHQSYEGMSLRDYFAAAAMQGILAHPNSVFEPAGTADCAYKYADAMLKARQS